MTTQLQFRIRPIESLLDLDPDLILAAVSGLPGMENCRLFDDRAADATFVTLVVKLSNSSPETLRQLRSALLSIPRVQVFIVDSAGTEAAISQMAAPDLLPFAGK